MKKNKLRVILGARMLRKDATPAEILLWKFLDNRGMCGFKFRRQHPVKGFILDFYCPQQKLAIEIDGEIHNNHKEQDSERQKIIETIGVNFLRFSNLDVIQNTEMVLKTIKRKLFQENNISPLHGVERGAERSEAG